jgi:hypothetical protein
MLSTFQNSTAGTTQTEGRGEKEEENKQRTKFLSGFFCHALSMCRCRGCAVCVCGTCGVKKGDCDDNHNTKTCY